MNEILSKGSVLFVGHLLVSFAGLLVVPVIIRLSNVETLGVFSLFSAVLSFLYGISGFGVGFRARRYLPGLDDPVARSDLFYPQLFFQGFSLLILGSFTAFMWPYMFSVIGNGKTDNSLGSGLIVIYLISQLLYAQFADYFRYTHRVRIFTIATSTTPFLALASMAVVYAIMQGLTINSVISCQAFAALSVGSALVVMAVREIGVKLRFPRFDAFNRDIRLGFPLMLAYVIDVLLSSSDRFVIGGILSAKEVGFYVSAYSLGMLIMLLPRMLGVLLPPIIARHVDAGERQRAEVTIDQVARAYIVVSMTFAVGAAVLGKPILSLYATEEVAMVAWPIIPIVAVGAIFYGLMLIYANVLSVQLRTRDMFYATAIAAVLNVVLNLIFLPVFKHVLVAAVSTSTAYIIAWIMVRAKIRTCWTMNFSATFLMRASVVAALSGGLAFIVFMVVKSFLNSIVTLFVTLVLAIIAFFFLVRILGLVSQLVYGEIYAFVFGFFFGDKRDNFEL